jgi:hypothetical protein
MKKNKVTEKEKAEVKESVFQKIKKNKFLLLSLLIILLATIVRFYNFDARWGVSNDDTRDIMIAQEALRRHELPLIGSFSSAGPFVFGPFFYWFLMGSYILFPFITAPWIFTSFVSVITVGILLYCGKKIAGDNFALLVGLLTALSPQLVARSVILGQHTFVAFWTAAMILFFLLFLEKKKILFSFLIGICIGAGINFHYQTLNLLIFLPLLLFIPVRSFGFRVLALFVAGVGVLISLAPLLIWDSQQQFASFRNLLDYFLIGQYRLYVPNSWRLFIFDFLPSYWSFVIGGKSFIALATMGFVGVTMLVALIQKKLSSKLILLAIPFGLLLFLNRYYRGERSEGYLLYFLPFILIFTAYTLFVLFKSGRFVLVRRVMGIILLLGILGGNFHALMQIHGYRNNVPAFESLIDKLVAKYPDRKFVVYDYKATLAYYNQPLGALLSNRQLTDPKGMPIGLLCYMKCPTYPMLVPYGGIYLGDLSKEKNIAKNKQTWVNVNPEGVYDDLIGWSKRHELKSTFHLQKYLTDKLHF